MSSLTVKYKTLKSNEFQFIYNTGLKFVGDFFVIFLRVCNNQKKFGFVASKRVGNSVKRNKAKRIMREIVRINQNNITDNVCLILIARRNIFKANFWTVNESFLKFLKKISQNNYEILKNSC